MPMSDSNEVDSLVREALDALAMIDFDRYMDLWHEDCRVEYPTHPLVYPRRSLERKVSGSTITERFTGLTIAKFVILEIRPLEDRDSRSCRVRKWSNPLARGRQL